MEEAKLPLLKRLRRSTPDILLALGALSISFGVGMIYLPAGLIAAGGLLICGAVLFVRGDDG